MGNFYIGHNCGMTASTSINQKTHDVFLAFTDELGNRTEVSVMDLWKRIAYLENRVQSMEAEFYLLGNKENKDG